MIAARFKTPLALGALLSSLFVAGCSQTTSSSHSMSALSVANLTDAITPSFLSARPYRFNGRDKECLERAMFFESNRSSRDGMVAVGTVVMNRLKSGKHGDNICAVVGEKNQFAPGVMTRKMNSRAMPDVEEAAEAVLKGERSSKLKNAMHFHTAGLKFPYKNMHYVLVAGGNAFYEKRGRNWKPLPDDSMFAFGGSTPDATPAQPQVMVASAEPAALPGVKPVEAMAMAPVQTAAAEPVSVAPAKAVRQTKAAPLPESSPFALASADPQDVGFDTAEPAQPKAQRLQKQRKAAASATAAVYEVASVEPSEKPLKKRIIDPDAAPLPTARASMVKVATPKLAKRMKAPAVQVAEGQPLAARFGRSETDGGEPVLSFDGQ